jgi:glycosyltransferase involved in cell wall biosynthesis
MKILILNWRDPNNPKSGGAEKVTLEYAKAWKKNGWDIVWLAGGYAKSKSYELIDGVEVYRYGNPYTIYVLAPFIFWFKFKGKFDLIIDEIHGIPFFTPIWSHHIKKIAYIHEVAQNIWDDMFSFPLNHIGRFVEKHYFFFYRRIPFLTVSESTKNDLMKFGIAAENITIFPNGLSLKIVKKPVEKNAELTLLYVSRLVKMKGIENAIEIFNQIEKTVKNSKLWIIGDGDPSYVYELKKKTKELNIDKKITFLGYVNESSISAYYQKAHVLLHTSVREGFGLVVIEANSQGTPAFVYNSPGLKDIVKNGINGYIFEKGDNVQIAAEIVSLFRDNVKFSKLAQSSIDYSKQFTWETIAEKSINYIKKEYAKK